MDACFGPFLSCLVFTLNEELIFLIASGAWAGVTDIVVVEMTDRFADPDPEVGAFRVRRRSHMWGRWLNTAVRWSRLRLRCSESTEPRRQGCSQMAFVWKRSA
jgi:hypothetical protein